MRSRTTPLIVLTILGGAAITMACGSSSAQSISTPSGDAAAGAPQATATTQAVATPTTLSPAPTSTPVAVATPTAAPAAVAPAAPPPPAPAAPPPPAPATSQAVTLNLGDNFFSTKELTVPAGVPITVTINNQGQALHNWDVNGVVKSTFVQHGQSQTVTFTAAPGTYTFQCDVHPKEMTGTLVVK